MVSFRLCATRSFPSASTDFVATAHLCYHLRCTPETRPRAQQRGDATASQGILHKAGTLPIRTDDNTQLWVVESLNAQTHGLHLRHNTLSTVPPRIQFAPRRCALPSPSELTVEEADWRVSPGLRNAVASPRVSLSVASPREFSSSCARGGIGFRRRRRCARARPHDCRRRGPRARIPARDDAASCAIAPAGWACQGRARGEQERARAVRAARGCA